MNEWTNKEMNEWIDDDDVHNGDGGVCGVGDGGDGDGGIDNDDDDDKDFDCRGNDNGVSVVMIMG